MGARRRLAAQGRSLEGARSASEVVKQRVVHQILSQAASQGHTPLFSQSIGRVSATKASEGLQKSPAHNVGPVHVPASLAEVPPCGQHASTRSWTTAHAGSSDAQHTKTKTWLP